MKGKLSQYMAKTDCVSPEFDLLEWWKIHQCQLPGGRELAKISNIQSSLSAAEHVFTLLWNSSLLWRTV